jgi:riboflavin synthase
MFTGLVEEIGECVSLERAADTNRLTILAPRLSRQIRAGESVAVNGACLTVATQKARLLHFDLLQETLSRTNLGDLRPRSKVNLERPLQADGRLGGHFVQGHVDCTVRVLAFEEQRGELKITVELPRRFSVYVVSKGSICLNGVSLTVAELTGKSFAVWIIPHTRQATNLGELVEGSRVNLEFDILAKYIERLLGKVR